MNNSTILSQVPREHKIKRELKKVLFGKTMFCPRCGSPQIKKYEKRYRCKVCRKPFSITSISWLKGMKIPLTTFWLMLWAWTNKTPVDQAMKLCGVSEPTARRWYEKFREHLPQDKLDNIRLSGIVQMDEAYRGKKDKKYSIIGAKQKARKGEKRKISLQIIPKSSVDRSDAVDFLVQRVVPESKLRTDGASIYKNIGNWWPLHHQYEIHKKFEFALTSEIEGLWGNLFTFIRRMYHHATKEKIESIVKEFTARSIFPEWFNSPNSFLGVAFQRITRPTREEWRGRYQTKKKERTIFQQESTRKLADFPLIYLPNDLSVVPS